LIDAFGSSTVALTKPQWVCSPASKNGETPTAPNHPDRVESYRVKAAAHFGGGTLTLQDWRGNTTVKLKKQALLMVPTAVSLTGVTTAPTNPIVDRFQCYKVHVTNATGTPLPVMGVVVDDLFASSQTAELIKLKQVCVPVDTNGQQPGADGHTGYLVCYMQRTLPKFVKTSPVYTANELGNDQQLAVVKPAVLCMPASRLP